MSRGAEGTQGPGQTRCQLGQRGGGPPRVRVSTVCGDMCCLRWPGRGQSGGSLAPSRLDSCKPLKGRFPRPVVTGPWCCPWDIVHALRAFALWLSFQAGGGSLAPRGAAEPSCVRGPWERTRSSPWVLLCLCPRRGSDWPASPQRGFATSLSLSQLATQASAGTRDPS